MTEQCTSESLNAAISSSPMSDPSQTYLSHGSSLPQSPLQCPLEHRTSLPTLQISENLKFVGDLTSRHAHTQLGTAGTPIAAQTVEERIMPVPIVLHLPNRQSPLKEYSQSCLSRRPRYTRDFLWSSNGTDERVCLGDATLYLEPPPPVPENEILNSIALQTIRYGYEDMMDEYDGRLKSTVCPHQQGTQRRRREQLGLAPAPP
ncbi:hypothetical protein VKT23_014401 [Stygiomarasmius scandens]|uniref:Uncharacterized protein n=1 Tax=Marasmiellus scandens TaxID=2682957 RepID=A0ABR1J0H9_9AGAR